MTAAPATWSFACPDWFERMKRGESLVPTLPLDKAAADKGVAIFNNLRLPDVAGNPPLATHAGEWFRDIVRAACGSIDPETGRRNVEEIFALVPKKNSKTTGGAAIMLTLMLLNERPRAEMFLVGPTQEVADLSFQQAVGMIEADPEGYLQKRFLVQEHLKTIIDRRTKAKLKIKTFDMRVMTGGKPVVVLLDELHIMSGVHYASRVLGQIRGGLMANPESLLIITTTQSDTQPAGVFKGELQRARAIRDGRIVDAHMLPILYEYPEAMQIGDKDKPWNEQPWADPKNWPLVTPNLGLSISIERLISDFKTAQDLGEEEVRRWASQHLNVEIGLALHTDRWRGADYWLAAEEPELAALLDDQADFPTRPTGLPGDELHDLAAALGRPTATGPVDERAVYGCSAGSLAALRAMLDRCEVAVVGGDGGGLDDLLGLAVIGRERKTLRWLIWVHAWAQDDVLRRRKDIAERLQDFARQGDLTVCTSPTQDLEQFAAICALVKASGLLPADDAIGLDPAGVSALVDELGTHQIGGEAIVGVPQGFRLSGAVWGLERKLKDGTAVHCGQPLLTWCVGNAKAEARGNAVLITKETAGRAKIDPLMAVFDAFELMKRNPGATRSVYEDRGLRVI